MASKHLFEKYQDKIVKFYNTNIFILKLKDMARNMISI